jgi:nucleoid-associated protein YgaU
MNRYQFIPKRKNKGKRYVANAIYPEIPLSNTDTYVITNKGDRFDTLANQFYGDKSLWWVISLANQSLKQNSLYIPPGTQIRIPINPTSIVNQYNNNNQ